MNFNRRLIPTEGIQKLTTTRTGTLAVAGVVALAAGAMMLFFMDRYRQSVDRDGKTVAVLVARSLIEKGSPGDVIASKGMFETASVTEGERETAAITDPSVLRGKEATTDIYPGEQLVAGKFVRARDSVINKISARERAVSIPLDSAHGMIGEVHAGDRVDVLAGFNVQPDGAARPRPVLKAIMQNALVLEAPEKALKGGLNGPNNTQNVVLRAPDANAWDFAFTAEFGKVWIVLRPKAGAEATRPSLVTLERLLFGIKPIEARKMLRGAQ